MLSLYLSLVDNEEQRTLVEQIYSDCEQIMYRTAYSILHNKQDAEDAVHDAFLRIVSDIDRIASVDPGKRRNYAVIVAKILRLTITEKIKNRWTSKMFRSMRTRRPMLNARLSVNMMLRL